MLWGFLFRIKDREFVLPRGLPLEALVRLHCKFSVGGTTSGIAGLGKECEMLIPVFFKGFAEKNKTSAHKKYY